MTDDVKPDPIPDGEDEGSSPVPTEPALEDADTTTTTTTETTTEGPA